MTLDFLLDPLRALAEKFQDDRAAPFSLNNLNSMNASQMQRYASATARLPFLGSGSSRTVYNYKGYALKLATSEEGLGQNALEARVGSSDSPVVVNVLKIGRANKWILTELVQPLDGGRADEIFQELTGVDFERAYDYWQNASDLLKQKEEGVILDPKQEEFLNRPPRSPFVAEVLQLILDYNLQAWDMRLENLGTVERDGQVQLVILDVGLSDQVMDQYYDHHGGDEQQGYAAKGVQERISKSRLDKIPSHH